MQYTFLIVEGQTELRDILTRYLEHDHHRVLRASSGQEARALVQKETIDLLIIDATMPGESGLEVLSVMKAFTDIPLLMISEKVDEENRILGLPYLPDALILKPFSVRDLLVKVDEMMTGGGRNDQF